MRYETIDTLLHKDDDSDTKEEYTQHNKSSNVTKNSKTQTKQKDPLSEENLNSQQRYPLLTQMTQDLDKKMKSYNQKMHWK